MGPEYVRVCPTCGSKQAPDVIRCTCGAMLFGLDLVRTAAAETPPAPPSPVPAAAKKPGLICPYDDCGQTSPPDSDTCIYCNRPLATGRAPARERQPDSLMSLPPALADRYRIVHPFPAGGAEAELLLVEPLDGGRPLVAKIYRAGIHPKDAVQQRIARIDPRHRIRTVETGTSGGHAFEVMEHCPYGSLRDRLTRGPIAPDTLVAVARELAAAIAAVHAAGVVHRDLKPENVLIRLEQPLELVLIDFGIASVLDATQRFTGAARTLPYASPESLSGVIDGKADYWAMGMILLEATLGKHPFAGLSDAVILHHLTTRSIDVAAVQDGNLRKLLKGLLLRDPRARWGRDEIARWLAGDTSLPEPVERGPDAGFRAPYHLGDEICSTPEQLATALSRNWATGIADLTNGQLLRWFRDVQKDQNAVRLLIELQQERLMHVDVRLLKLLLHLAPGIPPVWRGENIELPAILPRANLALKGDADAARWLHALYVHGVLEAYAEAGNADAAEIVLRWNGVIGRFAKAWKAQLDFLKKKEAEFERDQVALFDELLYGRTGPPRPSLRLLHPRILALAYDPAWAQRLRKRIAADLAALTVQCPWLAELGDPLAMDAASLLALESLLPEARRAADGQNKARARRHREEIEELRALEAESAALVERLRTNALENMLTPGVCHEMRGDVGRWFGLLARVQSAGRSDEGFLELRQSLKRAEPCVNHIRILLDILAERRTANAGWMSGSALAFGGLALLLVPSFFGVRAFYLIGSVIVIILAWRTLPNYFTMRNIRKLATRL